MLLPPLLPDTEFERLGPSQSDFSYSFEVKRAAMSAHVAPHWGWDEAVQQEIHRAHFAAKPFYRTLRNGKSIGTLSFHLRSADIRIGEFYLLPEWQNQGIGARIVTHCLGLADSMGLPVRLEYLRWNPAGRLYARLGFCEVARTDTHIEMLRPAPA
ncbi:MAG: GNAT family N-acetyltransferase [Paracoccaceae bacterium]